MSLTKSAIFTWASLEDRGHKDITEFDQERQTQVEELRAAGLTDGYVYFSPDWSTTPSDSLITKRNWTDQTAAENWSSYVINLCIKYGHTAPDVVYEDYTQ
jgi:hypothetical protein